MEKDANPVAFAERGVADEERRKRPLRRRAEILAAAAEVFYEKGYDGSTTQDIADRVGILKGSLYYYVDSKEDLLFDIIAQTHEQALLAIEPARELEGDALSKLAEFVVRQVDYFAANHVFATVFFREYRALSAERREPIESQGNLYRQFVGELIRQGQQEGTVVATIDTSMVSIALVEMLNSIHRWYQPDGRLPAEEIGRELASILVLGLASDEVAERHGGVERLRRSLLAESRD